MASGEPAFYRLLVRNGEQTRHDEGCPTVINLRTRRRRAQPGKALSSVSGISDTCVQMATFSRAARIAIRDNVLRDMPGIPRGTFDVFVPSHRAFFVFLSIISSLDRCHCFKVDHDADALPALITSRLLGLDALFAECRKTVIDRLSRSTIMQAGHYASLWNDVDLLEHCYRWLALHYVERGDTNSIIATGDALKQGAFSIPYSSILLAGTRSHARTVLLTQQQKERFFGRVERSPDRLSYTLSQNDDPLLVATYSTTTSEFVFSAGTEGCERHGASYAGSLVGNLPGTMFTLYDDGVRVAGEEVPVPVHGRVELCVISYQTNMMGAEPRQFTIDLDRTLNERTRRPECHCGELPDNAGARQCAMTTDHAVYRVDMRMLTEDQGAAGEGLGLGTWLGAGRWLDAGSHIVNKPPVWNHAIGGHCLDFGQYVKAASKKNFQMIRTHTPDSILLQFGKLSKGVYHIDFGAPFSIMTAFALAVSSLCHKRLVQ